MSILIVAPWGDPSGWKWTKYFPPQKEEAKTTELFREEKSWEGRSSTGALVSFLEEEVYVLILCSWTLAVKAGHKDIEINNIRRVAKDIIEGYLKDKEYLPHRAKARVEVLPGIGVFHSPGDGMKWSFRGGLGFYNAGVFTSVYDTLNEVKPEIIVLDITHGINYMPVVARNAVELASSLYASLEGKSTEYYVINSDPVTLENSKAMLHIIEHEHINAGEGANRVIESFTATAFPGGLRWRPVKYLSKQKAREVSLRIDTILGDFNLLKRVKHLSVCVNYGFILYLAQYLRDELEKCREELERLQILIRKYKEPSFYAELNINDSITIEMLFDLKMETTPLLATSKLLIKSMKPVIESTFLEGVSLTILETLANNLSFSRFIRVIAKNELYNIKRRIQVFSRRCSGIRLDRWVPYYKAYNATRFLNDNIVTENVTDSMNQSGKSLMREIS